MQIRDMKHEDKKHVLAMMQVFYQSSAVLVKSPTEVLEKAIDDCIDDLPFVEGYVFEDAHDLVGYGMVAKSYSTEYGGMCLWIEDVYVVPSAQGKGYGSQFLHFIEEKYAGKVVRLRLEVTQENVDAIKLYERKGYSQMHYVEMSKKLR